MELQHMTHRHGGKVTAITEISHATRRGVASWFYTGRVEWSDGSVTESGEIDPNCVCFDSDDSAARAEYAKLSGAIHGYLSGAGAWHAQKSKRDGRLYSWTPAKPSGRAPL